MTTLSALHPSSSQTPESSIVDTSSVTNVWKLRMEQQQQLNKKSTKQKNKEPTKLKTDDHSDKKKRQKPKKKETSIENDKSTSISKASDESETVKSIDTQKAISPAKIINIETRSETPSTAASLKIELDTCSFPLLTSASNELTPKPISVPSPDKWSSKISLSQEFTEKLNISKTKSQPLSDSISQINSTTTQVIVKSPPTFLQVKKSQNEIISKNIDSEPNTKYNNSDQSASKHYDQNTNKNYDQPKYHRFKHDKRKPKYDKSEVEPNQPFPRSRSNLSLSSNFSQNEEDQTAQSMSGDYKRYNKHRNFNNKGRINSHFPRSHQSLEIPNMDYQASQYSTQTPVYPSNPQVGVDPQAINFEAMKYYIRTQSEYYFSIENLCRDLYFRKQMDPIDGSVPLSTIANFNRIKTLLLSCRPSTDPSEPFPESEMISILTMAIESSHYLEVLETSVRLRHGWDYWIVNNEALNAPNGYTDDVPSQESGL